MKTLDAWGMHILKLGKQNHGQRVMDVFKDVPEVNDVFVPPTVPMYVYVEEIRH
jgi:hypothetical protein